LGKRKTAKREKISVMRFSTMRRKQKKLTRLRPFSSIRPEGRGIWGRKRGKRTRVPKRRISISISLLPKGRRRKGAARERGWDGGPRGEIAS